MLFAFFVPFCDIARIVCNCTGCESLSEGSPNKKESSLAGKLQLYAPKCSILRNYSIMIQLLVALYVDVYFKAKSACGKYNADGARRCD